MKKRITIEVSESLKNHLNKECAKQGLSVKRAIIESLYEGGLISRKIYLENT